MRALGDVQARAPAHAPGTHSDACTGQVRPTSGAAARWPAWSALVREARGRAVTPRCPGCCLCCEARGSRRWSRDRPALQDLAGRQGPRGAPTALCGWRDQTLGRGPSGPESPAAPRAFVWSFPPPCSRLALGCPAGVTAVCPCVSGLLSEGRGRVLLRSLDLLTEALKYIKSGSVNPRCLTSVTTKTF